MFFFCVFVDGFDNIDEFLFVFKNLVEFVIVFCFEIIYYVFVVEEEYDGVWVV